MCGIVGGITSKNIIPLLMDGLKRLEYRGYDSSGLVILSQDNKLVRERAAGKVSNLANNLKLKKTSLKGNVDWLILDGRLMANHQSTTHTHTFQKTQLVWCTTGLLKTILI